MTLTAQPPRPRPPEPALRLTALSSCAGCAAKLSQPLLAEVMKGVASEVDFDLLVGAATADDAAVYRLSKNLALVQTLDFFPPIVDDPGEFGRIAAANALSDVYAMGGRPLTAMNIVGIPIDKLPPPLVSKILRGGASKVREAGASLVGGHTIRSPEPIYGLSVTGLVDPRRLMTNAAARPGDLLLLTKPLGTGIATTAIKRGLCSPRLARLVTRSMQTLNRVGHELAIAGLISAATDVTGFGLLGHLASMCRASGVRARIAADDVPWFGAEIGSLIDQNCIPGGAGSNWEAVSSIVEWDRAVDGSRRFLLADPQTSGGLLLCVPPRRLQKVRAALDENRVLSTSIVGEIRRGRLRIEVRSSG